MAGLIGGKTQSNAPTRLNGIQVQSSVAGSPIPMGWGTFRASANLLWYGGFKSTAIKQKTGGKGGGSQVSGYNYSASLVMGICAGPIAGIRTVYKDQTALSGVAAAGLTLFTGAPGQAPWTYLSTSFPAQAIGYSGIAYAAASNYALSTSATLPNHSFEVQSATRVSGSDDANPKDIVTSFLAAVPYWQTSWQGDYTAYGNYCLAAGLLLSPVIDSQRSAQDFLTEILLASNSDCVWSDGLLKIVPYADAPATGNGTSFTPDLTPVYALDNSCFIPKEEGGDPILVSINKDDDAWNYIQVEYLDRAQQYNTQVIPGTDPASIDQWGKRINSSPYSLHSICDRNVASALAQILVQRTANVRRTFQFSLPWNYCLLDPMDLVSINSGDLSNVLVRITEISEGADGLLDVTAEEMLVGTASPPAITRQTPAGYVGNYEADPGNVSAPVMVNPPLQMTGGEYELWIGVAGGANWGGCEVWVSYDNATYSPAGVIDAPARYGTSTSVLAAGSDPDTAHTVGIDLSVSNGSLAGATQAAADNHVTLALLGSEVIAYSAATLTGTNRYTLGTYIRRGLMGTTIAGQASGSTFLRLDSSVFAFGYRKDQVGKNVWIKFRSFNSFNQAYQDISVCTAYQVTLTPSTASFTILNWADIGDTDPNRPRPADGATVNPPGESLQPNDSFESFINGAFPGWSITGTVAQAASTNPRRGTKSCRMTGAARLQSAKIVPVTPGEAVYFNAGFQTISNDTTGSAGIGSGRWSFYFLEQSGNVAYPVVYNAQPFTAASGAQGFGNASYTVPAGVTGIFLLCVFEENETGSNAVGELDWFTVSRTQDGSLRFGATVGSNLKDSDGVTLLTGPTVKNSYVQTLSLVAGGTSSAEIARLAIGPNTYSKGPGLDNFSAWATSREYYPSSASLSFYQDVTGAHVMGGLTDVPSPTGIGDMRIGVLVYYTFYAYCVLDGNIAGPIYAPGAGFDNAVFWRVTAENGVGSIYANGALLYQTTLSARKSGAIWRAMMSGFSNGAKGITFEPLAALGSVNQGSRNLLSTLTTWRQGQDYGATNGLAADLVSPGGGRFDLDPSHSFARATASSAGASGHSVIVLGAGPFGEVEPILHGVGTGNYGDGGVQLCVGPSEGYDAKKSYRLSVWVYCNYTPATALGGYFGPCAAAYNMAGSLDGNPYWHSGLAIPTAGKWYLMVGILHGSGYTGGTSGLSGLYNPATGLKALSYSDYRADPASLRQGLRFFAYTPATGALWDFAKPMMEELTAQSPSIATMLGKPGAIGGLNFLDSQGNVQGDSAYKNSANSLSAGGTFTNGGGGSYALTAAGLEGSFGVGIRNSLISVDGTTGAIGGIGTGSGAFVDNARQKWSDVQNDNLKKPADGATAGRNAIVNPGAESGSVAPWKVDQSIIAVGGQSWSGTFGVDTISPVAGKYRFVVTKGSTGETAAVVYPAIAVKPGQVWTFRAVIWGAASSASGLYIRIYEKATAPASAYVDYSEGGGAGHFTAAATENGPLSATPTLFQYSYTVPAGVYFVSPSIIPWVNTSTCYFDEVEFFQATDFALDVTGATKPADNATADVTLVAVTAGVTIKGNGYVSSSATDASEFVKTAERIVGSCVVQTRPLNLSGVQIGITTIASPTRYNDLSYAASCGTDGALRAFASGSILSTVSTYAANDVVAVVQDETQVFITKNALVIYTFPTTPPRGQSWIAGSTTGPNGSVNGIMFRPGPTRPRSGATLENSSGAILSDARVDNGSNTMTLAGVFTNGAGGTYSIAYDSLPDGASYAKVKASELSSGIPGLAVAGSGKKVGDARNLPNVVTQNLGYKFTGGITYSAAAGSPATATISVAAGTLYNGSVAVSYNAMSANVSGTGGTTVTYFLYVDDAANAGGSQVLGVTTTGTAMYQSDGRILIGSCDVFFPVSGGGSGGGTGGGGSFCVWADAWVETRDRGFVRARDITASDVLRVLTDDRAATCWEVCTANTLGIEKGWRITSASGVAATVSESTPITLRDGRIITVPQIDGHDLPVFVDTLVWEPCAAAPVGPIEVAKILVGQKTYAAGDEPGRSILTHNPKP